LSSHVVSCGSAICPIMPSTASVAMKPLFGVKPGRFYLRSTIWIAASHRRECDVCVGGEQASRQFGPDSRTPTPQSDDQKARFNTMGPPPQAPSSPEQAQISQLRGRLMQRSIRHVIKQPCLVCGRRPSDPHHLRFAQSRALVAGSVTSSRCRSVACTSANW
jgi:hypothetical protein